MDDHKHDGSEAGEGPSAREGSHAPLGERPARNEPADDKWRRLREWINTVTTVVLVAATVALAFYTGGLFNETKHLAADADANAHRQLRAYLGVDVVRLVIDDSGAIKSQMVSTNSGQTPATRIREVIFGVAEKHPFDTAYAPHFPSCEDIAKLTPSPFYVHRDGSRTHYFTLAADNAARPLTKGDVPQAILSPAIDHSAKSALWVWGKACYLDIYNVEHWSEYCAAFRGPELGEKIPCTHGEDAN